MNRMIRLGIGLGTLLWCSGAAAQGICVGDCDGNRAVVVAELIRAVNIALGSAQVSTCPSADPDSSQIVVISELITAVNNALSGCPVDGTPTVTRTTTATRTIGSPVATVTPTATPVVAGALCGNGGALEAGEQCDDGNNFGGDGCAANCTREDARVAIFDPTKTTVTVQIDSLPFDVTLTGRQTFRTGQPRNETVRGPNGEVLFNPGQIPVAVRANEVHFDPVSVPGLRCACVRGIPVPAFGNGITAVGEIGCGAAPLTDINYRLVQDHNTNPGDPNNRSQGTPDDAECDDSITLPGGIVSVACKEGTGANCSAANFSHTGVCNGPRQITLSGGPTPPGSVFLLSNSAIGLLSDGGACDTTGPRPGRPCPVPDYGMDCLPCTDDDLDKGIPQYVPFTSGTAQAAVFDANNNAGSTTAIIIDQGRSCSGFNDCITSATGKPLDCEQLLANPTGGLSGSALAVAFPSIDARGIGDNVTSATFSAQ